MGRACNRAREDYEMCKGYACCVCGTKGGWSQLLARSGLDLDFAYGSRKPQLIHVHVLKEGRSLYISKPKKDRFTSWCT